MIERAERSAREHLTDPRVFTNESRYRETRGAPKVKSFTDLVKARRGTMAGGREGGGRFAFSVCKPGRR